MPLKAIFLGSLGRLADTSDVDGRVFNLTKSGIDRAWSQDAFQSISLPKPVDEIVRYAGSRGEIGDAIALAPRSAENQREPAITVSAPRRLGLTGLVRASRCAGLRLGLVTTAGFGTVDAMLAGAGLNRGAFDFVGDATMAPPKPDPGIYRMALAALDLDPSEVLAVEDTPEHAIAAERAGIYCVSFPGAARIGGDSPLSYLVAAREARSPEQRIARRA